MTRATCTPEPIAGAARAAHHRGIVMRAPLDIPLCHYGDGSGRRVLSAELDELTLTYCLVERRPNGHTLTLRRHVPSLHEARRWATNRAERLRAC
jgi:hypothetical protein